MPTSQVSMLANRSAAGLSLTDWLAAVNEPVVASGRWGQTPEA